MSSNLLSSDPTRSDPLVPLAYTVAEAAAILSVSRVTIYRLIARGHIRPMAFLRHKRIPREQLLRFVNQAETL